MRQHNGAEEVPSYAVRLSPRAQKDVEEAALRLADLTQDPDTGEQWSQGLYLEISKLATLPRRYAVIARETRLFGQEMRRLVYRLSASSVAYLVLFSVAEEGEDGPTVTILHVRHGGRKPLTRAEAQQILANQ